jgi:GntR family transcriptional regulator
MAKKVPLYQQVHELLADWIRTMAVGDMLPPEHELEVRFGVSRATIRKAVENLVHAGLLEKRQGLGTIVRSASATQNLGAVYSWTEEMARKGLRSSSANILVRRTKPTPQIQNELHMRTGETLVLVSRIRLIDDVPTAIMVNYLREKYIRGFVDAGLSRESLYEELAEEYGIRLEGGEETICARNATPYEASLLQVPEGSALLSVRRRTFLRPDVPFEIVDMVARGDKYQYFATLEGGYKKRNIEAYSQLAASSSAGA